MGLGDWSFSLSSPDVDEAQQAGESPTAYVLRLAEAKVRAAEARAGSEHFIVAADTAVVDGGTLLSKPADARDAIQMLRRLRGHSHQVYTGLAALNRMEAQLLRDLCVTDVPMREYSDAEIDAYVASGDSFDKAGAYAIQNTQFRPVDGLHGCYASVMGLPLCHLIRLLSRLSLPPQAELPGRCQSHLNYACPVSKAILRGEQVG